MLIRLSEVDAEIENLEENQHEVPLSIHNLEQQIANIKAQIGKVEEQKLTLEKRRGEHAEFVHTKSDWLKNREDQIKDLKTNKEFHAAQKEISLAKKNITDNETALTKCAEEIQTLESEIENAKATHQPKIDELNGLIKTEKSKLTDLQPLIEEKLKARRGVIVEMDPKILQVYERVRVKVTPALAKAEDFVCLECGSRMQPQLFNQLHICDTIHFCKNCKRILYLEESLQDSPVS